MQAVLALCRWGEWRRRRERRSLLVAWQPVRKMKLVQGLVQKLAQEQATRRPRRTGRRAGLRQRSRDLSPAKHRCPCGLHLPSAIQARPLDLWLWAGRRIA